MSFQEKKNTKFLLELDGYLWDIPLEDYSFSQELTQSQLDRTEMAVNGQTNYVNRSAQIENTNLGPVNWSITTPIRPFKSTGSGVGRADTVANNHHAVEEPLWAMMATSKRAGQAYLPNSLTLAKSSWTATDVTNRTSIASYRSGRGWRIFAINGTGYLDIVGNIDYEKEYTWEVSFGTGTPLTVYSGHSHNWPNMENIVDTVTLSPTIFINSYIRHSSGTKYDSNITVFDLVLMLPAGSDNLQTVIGNLGNLTVSATAKSNAGYPSRKKDISQQAEWNFYKSQGHELITANFYFITNTPVASSLETSAGSAKALIFDVPTTWDHIRWNVKTAENHRVQKLYKRPYIDKIVPDYGHYKSREVPGLTPGFFSHPKLGGVRYWDEDQNGNSMPRFQPKQMILGGTTYNVTNGKYTVGSTEYDAPTLIFNVLSSPANGTNISSTCDIKNDNGRRSNPNIVRGDIMIFDQNYVDYYGNTLGADLRFVVIDIGVNAINSRELFVIGYPDTKGTNGVGNAVYSFGKGNKDWINNNDTIVELTDTSLATTHTLTKSSLNNTEIITSTTSTTHGSDITNSDSITITSSNSDIAIGDLVEADVLPYDYYVKAVSGTTVTLHATATLIPASTVLTFSRTPEYAGLAAGEYRWYYSDANYNQLIIRVPAVMQASGPVATSFAASGATADRLKIFTSKRRHSGGSSVYKIKDCVIDTASIDVDIASNAKITWTGYGTEIEEEASNVTLTTSAPTTPAPVAGDIYYDIDDRHAKIRNSANDAWLDGIDEGKDSTTNFIANKLSTLKITDLQDTGVHQTVTVPLDQTTGNWPAWTYNNKVNNSSSPYDGEYYSSLKSGPGTGFAANVAMLLITLDDNWLDQVLPTDGSVSWKNDALIANDGSVAGVKYWSKWVEDYDWSLTIDGTTYGSGFYLGTEDWNIRGPKFLSLKTETTFGKFIIQRAGNDINVITVLLCTAEDGGFNTQSELNAAKISLSGTAKASTPTRQSFNLPITSANISIANNIQMITKNELGKINRVTGHQLGQRSVTGTYSAYLCDDVHLLRGLAKDNIDGYTSTGNEANLNVPLYPYSFDGVLTLGGAEGGDNTVTFQTPVTSINLPSIETEDIFSTNISFTALDKFNIQKNASVYTHPSSDSNFPPNIGDEIRVKYKGK